MEKENTYTRTLNLQKLEHVVKDTGWKVSQYYTSCFMSSKETGWEKFAGKLQ